MRREPPPEPCSAGSAASKWLTAERSSWTKWANSHQTPRSHYERFLAYPAISLSGGRSHWFYGRLQITIRGSDDANVDLDGLGVPIILSSGDVFSVDGLWLDRKSVV